MALKDKKTKIQSIINVFETGKPGGDYGNVSIFFDGPNRAKQITFGKSQTTASGNLQQLLEEYIANKGKYADQLKPYVKSIKTNLALSNDAKLIKVLKESGSDPIMQSTQDEFFDKVYWSKAEAWAEKSGFTNPLSMLVIYDSFIHSGSMLDFLRNRFSEKIPANGGSEKKWIEQYLNIRLSWLESHSNKILRKTTYRVKNMLATLKFNDWNLDRPFNANGVIVK